MSSSRAEFLNRGARGGVVLAIGGVVLAVAACGDDGATMAAATPTGAPPVDDAAIARLAATAELLAYDFYRTSIEAGLFTGDELAYLSAAQQNEHDHYDALAEVLGPDVPKDLTFVYPDGTFDSLMSIATTGVALEEAFVGAYMGAIPALSDNALKVVAAQIGANEAQHLTTFRSLAAGGNLVPDPSLPKVLTATEVTAAVMPFVG